MMANGRFAGHSVLVTGASSGISLGIARKMAEEGAAVGVNYGSHQEPAEKLAAEIRAWGGKAAATNFVFARRNGEGMKRFTLRRPQAVS